MGPRVRVHEACTHRPSTTSEWAVCVGRSNQKWLSDSGPLACMSRSVVADGRRVNACPRGPRGYLERRSCFSYRKARQLARWGGLYSVASSSWKAPHEAPLHRHCGAFPLLDSTPSASPQRANWRAFRYKKTRSTLQTTLGVARARPWDVHTPPASRQCAGCICA